MGHGLVFGRGSPTELGLVASLPIYPALAHLSSQPVLSCRGQGGLPQWRRGARGQPRTLISAESDTRRAESVDIYYCSQKPRARGGGGQAGLGEEREGDECGACGRPECVCELVKGGRGELSLRKIKVARGPGIFQPAYWHRPGIEVVVVVVRGAEEGRLGSWWWGSAACRGSAPAVRPPVTRRTQVHLCRAVAGIKVPYGSSEGGRVGWKTTPRAHKARIVPATSIMPRCSQEPVSQLPA